MNRTASFRVFTGGCFFKLVLLICAGVSISAVARAGDTNDGKSTADTKATVSETAVEEPKNWIELAMGGTILDGDKAQFEQEHRIPAQTPYGGIESLHYEQALPNDIQLTFDGHALWDFNDYDLRLELSKPKFGYVQFGFDEFRTWYDGNGGWFPHHALFLPPFFPEMHIDRGDVWVEFGLRVPDLPEVTLRYEHEFRDGMKDSTIWGDTALTGLRVGNTTRKFIPSFRNIDEKRDIVALEISKTFDNTDVLLGMRYEHIDDRDDLNMERNAGQLPPPFAGRQRFVTQHSNDDIDLFSGHAITETRFSDSSWFTAGYSYTTLENDLSGSRTFGTQFDSAFGEPVPTLGQRDHAFIDLAGMAQLDYHVVNANLFWTPLENLSIISGFRYTHEDQDASANFLALEPVANTAPFTPTNPRGGFHFGPPTPVFGERTSDYDRFAERIDLRYTGIKDWVFYAEAELEEEHGHFFEQQENEETPIDKDEQFIGQRYVVGLTWYPTMRLTIAAQYYHKIADYDNDLHRAFGQRLVGQDWDTDDANIRVTLLPKIPACLGTLSLTSRYDFIRTSIDGQWALDTAPLQEVEDTGVITKHMIAESITWSPLPRLYLQADGSVVLNQTETPASKISLAPLTSPTVLNFRNDYWTVSAAAGYVIDDKTDVRADYTYYCANDWVNNAAVAMPYGMGASEHTASICLTRQISKNMRFLLKYTYFNYADETFGGHNNYRAHSIYSSLLFRF